MQENTHKEPRKGTLTERAEEDVVLAQKEMVRKGVRSASLGVSPDALEGHGLPGARVMRTPPPAELSRKQIADLGRFSVPAPAKIKRTGTKANQHGKPKRKKLTKAEKRKARNKRGRRR
jgi:hypothetical protein